MHADAVFTGQDGLQLPLAVSANSLKLHSRRHTLNDNLPSSIAEYEHLLAPIALAECNISHKQRLTRAHN
jgi:hypothetical protein